jgi:phosphomannomutase
MTRDSLLPMLAPLIAGAAGLGALVAGGPQRFTAADRLEGVPTEASGALIDRLRQDGAARAGLLAAFGPERALDLTDGLRVIFTSGRVLHLRPSGNAPEMRLYSEAETPAAAQAMLATGLTATRAALETGDRA